MASDKANSHKKNFLVSKSELAKLKKLAKNFNKSDFSQWYLVTYFSRKIISAETQYITYNIEHLAIVEAFKTWRHYLESCKHEVLVLTNHNNLHWFINTKSLNSRQARPIELQMLCFASFEKILMKKKSFKPKILKFFIIYNPCSQEPVFQALALAPKPTSHRFIKFLSVEPMFFYSFVNSKRIFKPN